MRFKRLLALLLAAALALAVLVGCGSGQQSAAQALLKLLDGRYPNISIEIDPDLEADLRQAVNEGETDAEIRAALEKLLGSGVSFRLIGDGQQGDSAWNLILYPGSDPDAAARSAYLEWDKIFSSFPASGLYTANLSMIETDNGYAILVRATVDKAARRNDDDDDEPEEPENPGYTDDGKGNYTVTTADGLKNVAKLVNEEGKTDINITLDTDLTLTGQWTPIGTGSDNAYTGTFDGDNHTISGLTVTTSDQYAGLFGYIGKDGTVKNVKLENVQITSDYKYAYVGGVAGNNDGAIENCSVSGSVSGNSTYNSVGGVVGDNYGTIQGCSAAVTVKDGKNTGGIAGSNSVNSDTSGTITNCCSTGTVTNNNSYSNTGGVVGCNDGATITACYSTGDITSSGKSSNTGGVVGQNMFKSGFGKGQIIACYHANGTVSGDSYVGGVVGWNSTSSAVTACYHADGEVSGSSAGGVVGQNGSLGGPPGQITACYWSGLPDNDNGGATKVDGQSVTWQNAVGAMNSALSGEGWQYELTGTLPSLTTNP